MSGDSILTFAIYGALGMLMLAMVLTSLRVILGPSLADRVLALDQLVAIAIGFIAVIAIKTGFELYIDIALALGLAGFLATAAFARFIFTQRPGAETSENEKEGGKNE
jgi:multicomponent Na+:H+ antiporter subunit F